MSISVNIGGVNKEVSQPYVDIGGTWKECATVSNNIDGVWKESFSAKATYTINIYRYGSLYRTLSCTEGSSVALPTIADGYSLASNSSSRSYTNGQTITPSGDMNLYVLFTYRVQLYNYGTLYKTLSEISTSTSATFSLPTVTPNSADNAFYGWTTKSGGTTKDYNGGSKVYLSSTSLYAVFSYYEYTGQSAATVTGQTNTNSGDVQTLTLSLSNVMPNSSYTLHTEIMTPKQIVDGTKYSVGYTSSNAKTTTGTFNGSPTSIIAYSSYTPVSGGSFQIGDKRYQFVTKYTYVAAGIEYTKYTSKTLKYRSVK